MRDLLRRMRVLPFTTWIGQLVEAALIGGCMALLAAPFHRDAVDVVFLAGATIAFINKLRESPLPPPSR